MAKSVLQRVTELRQRQRDLALAVAGEGVPFGPDNLPVVVNPERKERCRLALESFAVEYFPDSYYLPISAGQRADMETMQRVATEGGAYAFAAPRSDGKTTRCETATIWALLYGHRKCVPVVGADAGAAREIFESIKHELRTNEQLREDFPVPCWLAALSEDVALKAKGWTWGAVKLEAEWGKNKIVLPQLDGADGSGGVVVCRGITGRLRGMRIKIGKRPVRPDLFVIDDPQTDESAASDQQCATREKIILGAIMGSKGAKTTIAAMMPCTILRAGDLAARFLAHKVHPDWHGRTRSLVTRWPKEHGGMWKEYHRMRREESQEAANEYYRANREAMDAGAELDWPERFDANEISAIQSAENLLCDRGEEVFQAEYQNDPLTESKRGVYSLSWEHVATHYLPGRRAGVLPVGAKTVVAATDVNLYGLHSVCVGFANDMSGWVPWYGVHGGEDGGIIGDQQDPETELKRKVFEALVREGERIAGLRLRVDAVTEGAEVLPVGLWFIDAGYMPDVVRRYIDGPGRRVGVQVLPARGFNADKYRPSPKNVIGKPREQCHMSESTVAGRFIAFSTDYWREVWQKALLAEVDAPGALTLFDPGPGAHHRNLAEQCTRERLVDKYPHKITGQMVWDWSSEPGRHDYGDCMTMAYAAAAWGGIGTGGKVERQAPALARAVVFRPSQRRKM